MTFKRLLSKTLFRVFIDVDIKSDVPAWIFVFDLIFNVPSTILQLNTVGSSWVEPVLAWINVSCSRTTMQWRRRGSNPRPLGLESSTQPLSLCTPIILCLCVDIIFGARQEKACLQWFMNNKGADRSTHPCSLNSTFVILLWPVSHVNLIQMKFQFLASLCSYGVTRKPVFGITDKALSVIPKTGLLATRPTYHITLSVNYSDDMRWTLHMTLFPSWRIYKNSLQIFYKTLQPTIYNLKEYRHMYNWYKVIYDINYIPIHIKILYITSFTYFQYKIKWYDFTKITYNFLEHN